MKLMPVLEADVKLTNIVDQLKVPMVSEISCKLVFVPQKGNLHGHEIHLDISLNI